MTGYVPSLLEGMGKELEMDKNKLTNWVISEWDDQILHRPLINIHRRTGDEYLRRFYRKVSGGFELPRPSHERCISCERICKFPLRPRDCKYANKKEL